MYSQLLQAGGKGSLAPRSGQRPAQLVVIEVAIGEESVENVVGNGSEGVRWLLRAHQAQQRDKVNSGIRMDRTPRHSQLLEAQR